MYFLETEIIETDRIIRHQVFDVEAHLTFAQVIKLWETSSKFRAWYSSCLLEAGWSYLFWEHPPISISELSQTYEFVIIRGSQSDAPPDQVSFSSYYIPDKEMTTFSNLGGDAQLVVPIPDRSESDFSHLAQFLRTASAAQLEVLWIEVAQVFSREIMTGKRWLSTCGAGINWLHVRIDQRPKYYKYSPYRSWST